MLLANINESNYVSQLVFQWDFAPIPGKPDSGRLWTLVLRCTALLSRRVLTYHIIHSKECPTPKSTSPSISYPTPPAVPSTFLPEETSPVPSGSLHLFSSLLLFSHYIYICYIWWLGSFSVLCFIKRRPLWHMYTELFGTLSQTSEFSCFIPVSVFNLLHPGRPTTPPAIHHLGGCGDGGRAFDMETQQQYICRHS